MGWTPASAANIMPDTLGGPPPLPPSPGTPEQAPATFSMLAGQPQIGQGQPGSAQGPSQTAGTSEIGTTAVRLGTEIDQAMKMLGSLLPTMAPWVQETVGGLREQIGIALNSGMVPTSPQPQDNLQFPDGGGRM